jgi:ATP-binding cassette, subfamily B, bacterial
MPRLRPRNPTSQTAAEAVSTRERLNLLIGDRRWLVALLAGCSVLSGFTEAATLALVAQLAVSVVGGPHKLSHSRTLSLLDIHASQGHLILIAGGFAVLRLLFQIPLSVLPARISASVMAHLRTELFDAFSRASWTVQSSSTEGKLQEVMTNQVQQAVLGVSGTTGLITSVLQFLVLMATALALNVLAAVVVGAMTIVLFTLLRPMRSRGGSYAQALSRAQVQYAGDIAESNRLAEEAHVFDAGASQRARLAQAIDRSRHWYFRAQVLQRLVSNVYQSLIYLLLVGGIGALYLIGGSHAGALGGVVLVLLRAGMAGQLIQGSYQTLVQAIPFVERAQETLAGYRDSAEQDGGVPLGSIDTVGFERVSFAYNPKTPVLTDVSFTVRSGESIGIVGPSGAGKSTLVQLLLRLRRPVDGRYLINGEPAESFARADWYRDVSYVPQEPRLLHATVAENIRFFREIDDERVESAARLARIHDDIVGWPKGYQTIVGPRADAVSGGQQQRICLARALAADPDVLILDEPTSALDPQSEASISASLEALRSNVTLFIVAHRMSTLEMCDRVMVIVDGRMAGFDSKAALQRDNPYYRRASQLATAGMSETPAPDHPASPTPAPAEPQRASSWTRWSRRR